ncbi:MAG: intradiol ring-cleavage dioxygenase, partial [Bacteroidetes bacterium]|nr:intradiol ring-cleavage dioxygenase [Bacteroidota bacterium]
MNRKTFLKGLGLAGAGSLIPSQIIQAGNARVAASPLSDCVLIPSETEGPFPLDLTENSTFFRQDVREDRTGVQLNLKMKILGLENCGPMENVRVNIWHCDKDGVYSGYNTGNNPGDANATYLRGYQFTDVDGEVEFVTIFP